MEIDPRETQQDHEFELSSIDLASDEGRARLASLFREAQIGRCVTGVTHDANNLLGAALAYAELIGMDRGLAPESKRMLREIVAGVERCSGLLNAVTETARKDTRGPVEIDMAAMARQVLDLFRYEIKSRRITVETRLDDLAPTVNAEASELAVAIMQLLSNALDALENAEDKRLRMTLASSGGDVALSIWNSGPPVPDACRERIFEPLVTSKSGAYLGLGLAQCRETARRLGGDLTYDPERGFTLHLPARAFLRGRDAPVSFRL